MLFVALKRVGVCVVSFLSLEDLRAFFYPISKIKHTVSNCKSFVLFTFSIDTLIGCQPKVLSIYLLLQCTMAENTAISDSPGFAKAIQRFVVAHNKSPDSPLKILVRSLLAKWQKIKTMMMVIWCVQSLERETLLLLCNFWIFHAWKNSKLELSSSLASPLKICQFCCYWNAGAVTSIIRHI